MQIWQVHKRERKKYLKPSNQICMVSSFNESSLRKRIILIFSSCFYTTKQRQQQSHLSVGLWLPLLHLFFFLFFFFFKTTRSDFALEFPSLLRRPLPCLRLLALAFLLALLELPEPSRPRVPPLNNQASFVCHHSTLPRGVLVIP